MHALYTSASPPASWARTDAALRAEARYTALPVPASLDIARGGSQPETADQGDSGACRDAVVFAEPEDSITSLI